MIIFSKQEKKAYAIEKIVIINGLLRKILHLEEDEYKGHKIYYAAQKLNYSKLEKENYSKSVRSSEYVYSKKNIKSEKDFKSILFPEFEINDSEKAQMTYFNLKKWEELEKKRINYARKIQ